MRALLLPKGKGGPGGEGDRREGRAGERIYRTKPMLNCFLRACDVHVAVIVMNKCYHVEPVRGQAAALRVQN